MRATYLFLINLLYFLVFWLVTELSRDIERHLGAHNLLKFYRDASFYWYSLWIGALITVSLFVHKRGWRWWWYEELTRSRELIRRSLLP